MELDHPATQNPEIMESSDLYEPKSEEWQKTDTVAGAFRDPSIIETCFEYIQLTTDAFQTLLAPFITRGIPEELLKQFTSVMRDPVASHAVMISNDVLLYLEEQWTGKRRPSDEVAQGSVAKHAVMVYYAYLSERWQPRRVIACIVFNQGSIETMQRTTQNKIAVASQDNTPPIEVTTHDVTIIIQRLRAQSMRDNFLTAVETRAVFLDKQNTGGMLRLLAHPCPPREIPAFFQVLQIISSRDPRGSIEHITRFSGMIECLKLNSTDPTRTFIRPHPKER